MESLNYPTLSYERLVELPVMNGDNWVHEDRWKCQEIIAGVFIGPFVWGSKRQLPLLKQMGITHMVCVRTQKERSRLRPLMPDEFQYLVVEASDEVCMYAGNFVQHIPKFKKFVDDCLKNSGKCLVYCMTGCEYSPLLLVGYIMETHGIDPRSAFYQVQDRRMCVSFREDSVRQLEEYAALCKARRQISSVTSDTPDFKEKRKLEDVDPESEEEMEIEKKSYM